MKSTGMVRKIDELGRIVLPKELRRTLNLEQREPIEIFVEEEKVILRKYQPGKACMITGEISEENMVLADGKLIVSPRGLEIISRDIQKVTEKV
ncbi:AbrB/MazE/SpoVT family DNA-binding domain-containing protein [Priestia endophytica]|uniref:AbrB/MazE/SpoVT family DNA-binding domain-containing protein n=1 Tax=Priestia endophytica TaxID=135735 RepID=UPI000DCA70F3|nr:AbrB/MazE/SpoVT family DNA-binding domain-containing protein [Priestia endophytica]RAS80275.1 AbrB family transcriptional regulator [Priestia endophytica]